MISANFRRFSQNLQKSSDFENSDVKITAFKVILRKKIQGILQFDRKL